MDVVILDCGHVEVETGRCETTDCHNWVGLDDSWLYRDTQKIA